MTASKQDLIPPAFPQRKVTKLEALKLKVIGH